MPGYLETMRIPVLEGRSLNWDDRAGREKAVVIGETAARQLWPDRSPIGEHVRLSFDPDWYTVVGVVGDIRYQGIGTEPLSPLFGACLQNPGFQGIRLNFVIRTTEDPHAVAASLRPIIHSVDGNILLQDPYIMSRVIPESAVDESYRALLVGAFAVSALLIAAIGIFGVAVRTVARRNHEMAVRLALGAQARSLSTMILRGSLGCALVGIGIGLVLASNGGGLIRSFLFHVNVRDPLTYGTVAALAIIVSAAAAYVPARRALVIDPAEVLRAE